MHKPGRIGHDAKLVSGQLLLPGVTHSHPGLLADTTGVHFHLQF